MSRACTKLLLRSQDLWRQHRAIPETGGWDPAADYKPLRVLLARQMKRAETDLAFLEELRSDFKVWLERQHGLCDGAPDAAAPDPVLAEPVEETRRRRARS